MRCSMSPRGRRGADFSAVCWADDGRHCPTGTVALPGAAAGGRSGCGLRPVSGPSGADTGFHSGDRIGFSFLGTVYQRPVPMVPGRLGRGNPAVRCGILPVGGRYILLGIKPGGALDGLSIGRFCHFAAENTSDPPCNRAFSPEKNQKSWKKYLSFRREMV